MQQELKADSLAISPRAVIEGDRCGKRCGEVVCLECCDCCRPPKGHMLYMFGTELNFSSFMQQFSGRLYMAPEDTSKYEDGQGKAHHTDKSSEIFASVGSYTKMDAPAYDERLKNACSESQYNSLIRAVAAQWDSRPCCLYHCCCPLCASLCCAFTFAICFPCVTIQKFAETSFNTKLIEVLEMETKEWKGSARLDVSLGSEAVNAAEEVGVDQNGACLGSGRTIRADAWDDDSHVWADMGTTWPPTGYNLVITVPGEGREFRDAWRQKSDPAAATAPKAMVMQ